MRSNRICIARPCVARYTIKGGLMSILKDWLRLAPIGRMDFWFVLIVQYLVVMSLFGASFGLPFIGRGLGVTLAVNIGSVMKWVAMAFLVVLVVVAVRRARDISWGGRLLVLLLIA